MDCGYGHIPGWSPKAVNNKCVFCEYLQMCSVNETKAHRKGAGAGVNLLVLKTSKERIAGGDL
jgi:hypothetical protein